MDGRRHILRDRRASSERRIEELRGHLSVVPELSDLEHLSIYVTGSYGRREASEFSDLDLFFVTRGEEVGRVQKILLDAKLITLTQEMGFPAFSGDARYLQIHSLGEMKEHLGTPKDDFENLFTARLLLLLESVPLCHDAAYEAILKDIVDTYFRDFPEHESEFRPIFLLNDILRFWRTVCLNYESGRGEGEEAKYKARVKNLKLKFSRAFTCFSTVVHLVREPGGVAPETILEVIRTPPAERVISAARELPDEGERLSRSVLEEYAWSST